MQTQSKIRRTPSQRPAFAGLRKHHRKAMELDIIIQDAEGWEIPLESVDLSEAGMFVQSQFLFNLGEVHTLIFKSKETGGLCRIRARVVRVEEGSPMSLYSSEVEAPGMGYEFLDINSAVETHLTSLVAGA